MRFKQLDLNLLVVLAALLSERSVSRAADRLNLSQPAVSASLGRLREYFHDDILVMHGKKMVPTAHARTIEPLVLKALGDIEALVSAAAVFDPATSRRTFRICASEYVSVVLLLPLQAELEKSAPGLRIEVTPPSAAAFTGLENGDLDFLIVPEPYAARKHPATVLFDERHVVVGWRKNPVLQEPLTEEAFFACSQVILPLSDVPAHAEREIAELCRERHIDVAHLSTLSMPWMLANSRRLAVMPERLAAIVVDKHPLAVAPLPFPFQTTREMVQHHVARDSDDGMRWVLRQILERAAVLRRSQPRR